jgi:hypothetical protein
MASPYGHTLAGLSLFNLCYPRQAGGFWRSAPGCGAAILLALSPDLDFLPGIFIGQPSFFHQGPWHSLGLGLGLALLALLGGLILTPRVFAFKLAAFVFLMVLTHLVLDYLTEDHRSPIGFPFFWPFSSFRVTAPFPVFPHIIRDLRNPEFFHQLIQTVFVESVLLLPLFILSRLMKKPIQGS